jgi:Cu+-exporting ATPase
VIVVKDKVQLELYGMTCSACANRIEKVLQKAEGVEHVVVNYAMETASVVYDETKIDLPGIIKKVKQIGYDATVDKVDDSPSNWRLMTSILLSLPLIWTMIAHLGLANVLYVPSNLMNPWVQLALAAPVQFWIGFPFIRSAWKSVLSRVLNMDVLVVLGTMVAFGYSVFATIEWQLSAHTMHMHPDLYFETSSVLITFILLGKSLEHRAKGRASKAIQALLQLQVKKAYIFEDGMEREVDIADVQVGQLIRVKPGDKIPVDGIIVEGNIHVDESMLTGESMPVHKIEGDEVFSGTINGLQSCLIRTLRVGQSTVVAQIARTVAEAQATKAPIQRYADRISSIFVPIVIGIAILTFVLWLSILGGSHFTLALERAVAVLVVACPCALGLATPTSILAGTGRAAELGIFFRSGALLEHANRTSVVVFDKTGTLTIGKPVLTYTNLTKNQLQMIQSVEQHSEHPISRAIVGRVGEEERLQVENFVTTPGFGIQGTVEGHQVLVGNRAWLEHNLIAGAEHFESEATHHESTGATVVFCAIDSIAVGIIAVADQLRPDAVQVVRELKLQNIKVYLLTGDNHRSANDIATKLQIQHVYADLKPNDKATIINEIKEKGETVLMVGDGINDSPALAAADISVAIGSGTAVAMETAGITIRENALKHVLKVLEFSKLTMLNIKQNLMWALVYNAFAIPFAIFGLLKPWMAGAAMTFSSISVVLNALRLQKIKK